MLASIMYIPGIPSYGHMHEVQAQPVQRILEALVFSLYKYNLLVLSSVCCYFVIHIHIPVSEVLVNKQHQRGASIF